MVMRCSYAFLTLEDAVVKKLKVHTVCKEQESHLSNLVCWRTLEVQTSTGHLWT